MLQSSRGNEQVGVLLRSARCVGGDPEVRGDAAQFLRDGSHRTQAHWVATGYYRLDEDSGVYRPTWKGAVLITWRLLWPIKPLFRAWRRHQTSRLLRRLGIEV